MDETELRYAAAAVREADTVVALTGAGVSTRSGIPDFRSPGGVWEQFDPDDFHVSRFEADPEGFWADRIELVDAVYDDVEPNPAHEALAALERDGHLDAVVTQNIDGLHQAAGSEDVIEVHGNGSRVVCPTCRRQYDAGPFYETVRETGSAPRCPDGSCDGVLKPDVTLFGEPLPEHALYRAHALAERADLFLVAGSSLSVEPAGSLPATAADNGATIVVVNLEPTEMTGRVEYQFLADTAEALPRLRETVRAPP
jgi:NAD-dependent deacetylase